MNNAKCMCRILFFSRCTYLRLWLTSIFIFFKPKVHFIGKKIVINLPVSIFIAFIWLNRFPYASVRYLKCFNPGILIYYMLLMIFSSIMSNNKYCKQVKLNTNNLVLGGIGHIQFSFLLRFSVVYDPMM